MKIENDTRDMKCQIIVISLYFLNLEKAWTPMELFLEKNLRFFKFQRTSNAYFILDMSHTVKARTYRGENRQEATQQLQLRKIAGK